ncbi:MAG: biotin--[acetyl-CoA-carboxylase] ligase [Gammaproteobacteria bacterium]|nr:biotin--[acetyl-CoA-carboxylase] ligase [Gammaproteobacteria bacterium]
MNAGSSGPRDAGASSPGTSPAASPAQRTFAALADGELHSGESLAAAAGVTRSAVWKSIEALRELGLRIEAGTHRGYRLAHPSEALDAAAIRRAVDPALQPALRTLEVEWTLPSSNAALLARAPPPPGTCDVLFVEHQTAGRGRRGRGWLAPLGGSLALSLAASFDPLPRDLASLSLVVGLCTLRALARCGARGLRLKWPNDLVTGAGKVGGILIELRAEAGGPAQVVIGVGLNLRLDAEVQAAVAATGTSAVDLASTGVDPAARNAIAGALLDEYLRGIARFTAEGFAPFAAEWQAADALRDLPVRVSGAGAELVGIARGIDAAGALRLELADGRLLPVVSGEVSVRAVGAA